MAQAVGIHDHPEFKIGLAETDPLKPILDFDPLLTGITPRKEVSFFEGVVFGLDDNDRFGDCGPTSVDNLRRATSKFATGTQRTASLTAVFDLYKRSGNPNFNPSSRNPEDNGVEMGTMLDALRAGGLDGDKAVATGRLLNPTDATIEAVINAFGGGLFAVNLLEAQQTQSNATAPEWHYVKSPEWGGHAIYAGKYEPQANSPRVADLAETRATADRHSLFEKLKAEGSIALDTEVISWAKQIGTAEDFRAHQLEEVWVVVFPWHLEHPAFLEGVNVEALAEAYRELTGSALPIPKPSPQPTPTPAPTPGPRIDPRDEALWTATAKFRGEKHAGDNAKAAKALNEWGAVTGLTD